MLEQAARSALFRAAEAGFEQAARAEISRVDPLLRGRVNKRMRLAIDAGAELTGPVDDRIDEAQQLRVAYLKHVGVLGDVDPKDAAAVGEAFTKAATNAPKPVGRLWLLTPLVVLVVLGGAGLAGWRMFGPSPERRLRDSDLGQAMGKDLTKWVVAAGAFRQARDGFHGVDQTRGKLKEAHEKVIASTRAALGDEGAKAMEELLEGVKTLEGGGEKLEEGEKLRADEKKVQAAAKRVNELIAGRGEPVVLDTLFLSMMIHGGDGVPRHFRDVYVLSYWVARRGKLAYAGKDTALRLGKRLDTTEVKVNTEGYDTGALGGVLVSLDMAERKIIRRLIKPLAGNTPWELMVKESAARLEGGEKMLDKAGEVLREELLGSAGVSQDAANSIAELLDQRAGMIGGVSELKVAAPSKLLFDDDTRERLEHFTEEKLEVFQLVEIDDKLRGYEREFHEILLVFADAVAVRGTVALLEEKNGETPPALLELPVPAPSDPDLLAVERMVMLAELAAIATSEKLARTLVSLVVSDVLEGHGAGRVGRIAVLSELATELGVKPEDKWVTRDDVTKDFPAFYAALIDKPAEEMRRAAQTAFERASGQKVPKLTWE